MDASVYSTDYQQVSQQLSVQSQRQIKVKEQNFTCAQIPRSLSSVPGKELIDKKSRFHRARPEASVCSWKTTGFLQDNPLQVFCLIHHWLKTFKLYRKPFPAYHAKAANYLVEQVTMRKDDLFIIYISK